MGNNSNIGFKSEILKENKRTVFFFLLLVESILHRLKICENLEKRKYFVLFK